MHSGARCGDRPLPRLEEQPAPRSESDRSAAGVERHLGSRLRRSEPIVPCRDTTKVERLKENVGAAALTLSADDPSQIADALAQIKVQRDRCPARLAARVGRWRKGGERPESARVRRTTSRRGPVRVMTASRASCRAD